MGSMTHRFYSPKRQVSQSGDLVYNIGIMLEILGLREIFSFLLPTSSSWVDLRYQGTEEDKEEIKNIQEGSYY